LFLILPHGRAELMPADRFIHPRLGRSEKVSKLKDFEFRVWAQYLLSADDFGVLAHSPLKLKSDNYALECRSDKSIVSALEHMLKCGLVKSFTHQGRAFLYQPDWQDWQKVTYPSRTINPAPTADVLETCSPQTQVLFSIHPGARKLPKKYEGASEELQEFSESSSEKLSPRAKRLTANGTGLMANGSEVEVEKVIPAKRIGARDVWWIELLKRYPQNRVQRNVMVQQAFNDQFREDDRPDESIWSDMLLGLQSQIEGYEWRVKGMVPSLEKWLTEGRWRQRHERAPVSTVVSEKTARNLTAVEQFLKAGNE
jgi:hypothetical protein